MVLYNIKIVKKDVGKDFFQKVFPHDNYLLFCHQLRCCLSSNAVRCDDYLGNVVS